MKIFNPEKTELLVSLLPLAPDEQIKAVEKLNPTKIKGYHFDAMDGKYNDVYTLGSQGPEHVCAVRQKTEKIIEAHMMTECDILLIKEYIAAGADVIVLQYGAKRVENAINYIRRTNKKIKIGIGFEPDDPLDEKYIEKADLVYIMCGPTGKSGQPHQPQSERITYARNLSDIVGVDIGINRETAPAAVNAGANWLASASWFLKELENGNADKAVKYIQSLKHIQPMDQYQMVR